MAWNGPTSFGLCRNCRTGFSWPSPKVTRIVWILKSVGFYCQRQSLNLLGMMMTCLVPSKNGLRALSYLVSESAKRNLKILKQGLEHSETLVFQPKKSSLKSCVLILKRSFFYFKTKTMDGFPSTHGLKAVGFETGDNNSELMWSFTTLPLQHLRRCLIGRLEFKGEICPAFNERCTVDVFFWWTTLFVHFFMGGGVDNEFLPNCPAHLVLCFVAIVRFVRFF